MKIFRAADIENDLYLTMGKAATLYFVSLGYRADSTEPIVKYEDFPANYMAVIANEAESKRTR